MNHLPYALAYAAATLPVVPLIAGGELHRDEVVERLLDACHRNHLIEDDGLRSVEATIRSGANAGLQSPRSRKGATW